MSGDDEGDPFERLGDADREGDPFERLDDGPDDERETGDASTDESVGDDPDGAAADRSPRSDPFADFEQASGSLPSGDGEGATSADTDRTDAGPTDADPFADIEERSGDPFAGGESAFERVDVGSVDADQVWDEITDDGDAEAAVPDDDRYAEVSKHAFCEQCEHFAAPPEAHCTHETAEIIEYLDMERVRVLDCPVVAQRQELE